jgi:tagatose 1,6-diphosphate aldolase GatY/KbaY
MPYSSTKSMLLEAQRGGYAVGAFNVENMEMAQAVIWAAEKLKSPVILQTSVSTAKYTGYDLIRAIVQTLAEQAAVPVALHLDHGDKLESVELALRCGFSSVMIDSSKLPFEENLAAAHAAVLAAQPYGIPVEAELGKVGGKEDDHEAHGAPQYTDPAEAVRFVAESGIDSLAVAIGTAHGVYKAEPRLDVERLSQIRQVVSLPLVLHGSSGLTDEAVRECVARGICKVNFATELRQAFSGKLREMFLARPADFDPKIFLKPAREAVSALVTERIRVCGSVGKA